MECHKIKKEKMEVVKLKKKIGLLILLMIFLSGCSLFNKQNRDNFDCARYTISHNLKFARTSTSGNIVNLQGVTRFCDDGSIAKATFIRIINEKDSIILYAKSDDKGRYKLKLQSGAYKISAVNPGGGIVETSFIDFGFYSMSTNINLYMQHPNAFMNEAVAPIKKNN
jgi:hypothetical protein